MVNVKRIAVCLLALVSVGCQTPPPNYPSPVETTVQAVDIPTPSPSPDFSAAELKAAQGLVNEKGRIDRSALSKKENGPSFVVLALTQDREDTLVDALQGLRQTYTPDRAYSKTNQSSSRVAQAVLRNLNSQDERVLAYAIRAAVTVLGKSPNHAVVEKLRKLALGASSVATRYEALSALLRIKSFLTDSEFQSLRRGAVNDDAPVSALLLESYLRQGGLPPALEPALKHIAPGVRSRAVLLSAPRAGDPKIREVLVKMLSDDKGVVRAAAVVALSEIQDPEAVAGIRALAKDKESCVYPIKFTDLTGKTQRLSTPELPGQTVAEVVAKYQPQ